ncbi:hypothetical protein CC86DRAFT_408586 [Ophiobolus disseminans]|uniref:Exodeoxyribonuclease X-like C-terminal domain-containing protein n=1 Tax=Ophiobolus disseminans TaxID=1469910 RepID=A0A6A6ZTX1_9PLEO|nr:hypothetical protein CC86DRAFT_408586 [Ophiobolus disseminans]
MSTQDEPRSIEGVISGRETDFGPPISFFPRGRNTPSSSLVKDGGIRKSSPKKKASLRASPVKRTQRSSTTDEDGKYRYDFGKYKGKTIEEVMVRNPDYLNWCLYQSDVLKNHPELIEGAKAYRSLLIKPEFESPMKRIPLLPMERTADEKEAGRSYVFDFGKHSGETIQEVMLFNSSYLDWCLSESATDLIESRPDFLDGLRALSSEYLNTEPELREAMARMGIYPFDNEMEVSVKTEPEEYIKTEPADYITDAPADDINDAPVDYISVESEAYIKVEPEVNIKVEPEI